MRAACLAALVLGPGRARAEDFPPFDAGVGTQTFAPLYGFSNETRLVETADAIYAMGSDVVKLDLSWNGFIHYGLPPGPGITNLTDLAGKEPSYRHVFDMPFKYCLLWSYPLTVSTYWHNGMNQTELDGEYNENYNLARHFLRTYNNSGKTFLFGHWEGDWALLGGFDPASNPSPTAIQGMIDWLRIRQQAVTDARNDEPHTNVFVWHYTEVNLGNKAMTGGVTVANNVLPFLTNDLVSYSSYDTITNATTFTNALAYFESKAHTTGPFSKNVFVGEYGFPLNDGARTPQQQADLSKGIMKAAGAWGCPFTLYWQMYDNETNEAGRCRGFWLIETNNIKQPVYDTHRTFLGRAHTFKNLYRFWLGRNPDAQAFAYFSAGFDSFSTTNLLNQILASAEFSNRWSNAAYIEFLFSSLFGCTSTSDSDYQDQLTRLTQGTNREAVLDGLLDGNRFTSACPNEVFAEMLLGGTLCRPRVDPSSTNVTALAARLTGGEKRSVVWRELLDSAGFHDAELDLRQDDEVGSPAVFAKHFFNRDRDRDGLPDAWERQIVMANTNDAVTCIEDVSTNTDFDGDGLFDADEHRFGTAPTNTDSNADGVPDGVEVDGRAAQMDHLLATANLASVLNTRLEMNGTGEVAMIRTNYSASYTEAIVDWEPGGGLLSITSTPVISILPDSSIRGGTWQVAVQLFTNATDGYLGEPNWVPDGQRATRATTNAIVFAAQRGFGNATHFRLRFRIGPHDNGDTEPGFWFTEISARPAGSTDPLNPDSDADGMSDGDEAIAGTDGADASAYFRIGSATRLQPDAVVLSWQSRTGRLYRVSSGGDFSTWTSVYETAGSGALLSCTNPVAESSRLFLRVGVRRD